MFGTLRMDAETLTRLAPVIDALLPQIPFDGWSQAAIDRAYAEAGADPGAGQEAAAPGAPDAAVTLRPIDAIAVWSALLDERMSEQVAGELDGLERIRDKIVHCTRRRLELLAEHKEAARRATTILAMPFNGFTATACLNRTVDRIWQLAGDTSTDHNWYTKRGLLAGVYGATLLYMLNDTSEGHGATWDFLGRRIDDVMKIPGGLAAIQDRLGAPFRNMPDPRSFWQELRDFGARSWMHRR